MTTTVVSNKMGIILAGIALMIMIVGAMINGGSGTNTGIVPPDGGNNINVPNTSEKNPSPVSPKDPTVFDRDYAQYLIDETMLIATVANNFEPVSESIAKEIKGEKELVWSPEKVTLSNDKGSDKNSVHFGLDGKTNDFYAGPVVIWTQIEPEAPVVYDVAIHIVTGGYFFPWGETPYKYGVVTSTDPPEEVLRVFSDNGVILHY